MKHAICAKKSFYLLQKGFLSFRDIMLKRQVAIIFLVVLGNQNKAFGLSYINIQHTILKITTWLTNTMLSTFFGQTPPESKVILK